MKPYGYAQLGTSGFGNLLFPWARCFLFCRAHGATMIAPRWGHLRIGPWLRRESDKRYYGGFFRAAGYVRGLRRWWILARVRQIAEQDWTGAALTGPCVVRFQGLIYPLFAPLVGQQDVIAAELRRITRARHLPEPDEARGAIGLHVRLGDFRATPDRATLRHNGHFRMPLEWYRAAVGESVPAIVFTNGRREELGPLLAEENVRVSTGRSAVADLLLLGQAGVIVGTGSSSFSSWASFLGQGPTLWYPGHRQEFLRAHGAPNALEVEWDEEQTFNDEFVAAARRRLAGGAPRVAMI